MQLKKLYIKDYKILKDFTFKFPYDFQKYISVLIGVNGSGKSTVLEAFAEIFSCVILDQKAKFAFGFLIILLIDSYHIKLFNLIEFQFKYSSISALLILSLIGGLIAAIFPIVKLYHTRAGEMINNFM